MENMQQKYMELQVIDQQIKSMQQQLQAIENQMLDLMVTKQSIEELKDVKIDSETLSPIAGGIFVQSVIKDNKELIVNVGSNVAVKKTTEEVKKLIEKQIEEIQKVQTELLANIQKLSVQGRDLESGLKNV